MNNMEWKDFYQRYIEYGEEFKFIYNNCSFWLTYDEKELPCFTICSLKKDVTMESIIDLLIILNHKNILENKAEIFLVNPITKEIKEKNFTLNSLCKKILNEEAYFVVNNEYEIYSYFDNFENVKKYVISKSFKTREDLLKNFKLNEKTIEMIWNELL